jgi:hypothetical protein
MSATRWATRVAVWSLIAGTPLAGVEGRAPAAQVLVEAEAFEQCGGWVVDPQFMDQMGSPFLLAHGLGVPVADAATTVRIPTAGPYRVWVRTRDWVGPWKAPGAPGKFQVLIQGRPLSATFGTEGAAWHWQDGGRVELSAGPVTLALHDLTGFEGRCDAVLLAADPDFTPPERDPELTAFRRRLLGLPEQPEDLGPFDLVVVGGGTAGTCAAISAARLGLQVALVQDRPVVGGNNSSEVRVWLQGARNVEPYPRMGDVVRELEQKRHAHYGPDNTAELYEDEKKLTLLRAEKNLRLLLSHRAVAVEGPRSAPAPSADPAPVSRIQSVVAQDVVTGRRVRLAGRWFADCTGDACVGYLAGADHELTRKGHLGQCNLWNVIETDELQPFPRCPWALDLSDKPFPGRRKPQPDILQLGGWYWESGFDRDPIEELEYIRDWNFRAMYGAWDALKNVDRTLPNFKLNWAAYISGKRESRRLMGDVVLTKPDLVENRQYPDGCVPTGWKIDLHLPDKRYEKGFEGDAFIAAADFGQYQMPYWVPYRCLYSRNIPNLFMAGRDISVTHEALGAVRVMRTGGIMGEVVGMAASLCAQHSCNPRDVYGQYLDQLQALMTRGVGKEPVVENLPPPAWLKDAGPNLARAARLRVSSNRDAQDHPPSLLTDGRLDVSDNRGRWLSTDRLPHEIELQWERPQVLQRVRIVSGYREAGGQVVAPLTAFSVQYYDGTAWKEIPATKVTANDAVDWHAAFPPVNADRLRVIVTDAPGGIARIWEIEVYGPGS